MLRAAVTAVRGVSFKPIHPLSGVYASVILHFRSLLLIVISKLDYFLDWIYLILF